MVLVLVLLRGTSNVLANTLNTVTMQTKNNCQLEIVAGKQARMQLFLKLLKADILLKLYNYLLEMEVLVLGKVLVLGFLSCIGIGIVKRPSKVLVLVLLRSQPNSWYWYWYC